MGQIDVSELLSDPDFVDKMVLVRRTTHTSLRGENTLEEGSISTIGMIIPASGKTIQRLPEALRVANVMSFFIKGTIVADGKNKYPDVLIFKGSRYAVQIVFDYTNWGEGFCEGTCVQERPAR